MKLKEFREKFLMMTQDELGRCCDQTSRTISAWENDEHLPKGTSPAKLRRGLMRAVLDMMNNGKINNDEASELMTLVNTIDILKDTP